MKKQNPYQITQWCRSFIEKQVKPGDFCIDATMGNGHDTLFLSQLAGPNGKVLAFDIQEAALTATRERLQNCSDAPLAPVTLLLDSHAHMDAYADPETVSCIVFNFGYLPSGDHQIATKKESSIKAIAKGLTLLKSGGCMSLCIYSGGDSGFEERDGLLEYLKTLDAKKYLVILSSYYNRPNHPPIPVFIYKL